MTAETSRYLFVYGTLMSGARSALGTAAAPAPGREADSLGPASLHSARLYDLGRYPGAASPTARRTSCTAKSCCWPIRMPRSRGSTPTRVTCTAPATTTSMTASCAQVRLAGGETFDAWVYLLRRGRDASAHIDSGRWISR